MSSNALAVKYTANDGQEVELTADSVNRYVVSGNAQATDAEIAGFLAICKARGLNPLARDAYLVKYGQNSPASTIVSKDYYNRIAQQQQSYDGMEAGVVVAKPDGTLEYREGALVGRTEHLVGGWAKVYDKRRGHPSSAVVSMDEYDQQKSLWRTKPATMIRKVAMVQALREAYPSSFQGLYDESEMPEAPQPVAAQAVDVEAINEDLRAQAHMDVRADEMRRMSARLASITGQGVADVKRMLFAQGDFRKMDDAQWADYKARVEKVIQDAVAAKDAAGYDGPLDEGDYTVEEPGQEEIESMGRAV